MRTFNAAAAATIAIALAFLAGSVAAALAQTEALSPAAPAAQQPAATAAPADPAPAAEAAVEPVPTGDAPADPAPVTEAAAEPVPRRELSVGVLENAPGFSAPGSFGLRSGFDVDVALALCEQINARCNLVALPADDIFPALSDRRIALAFATGAPQGEGEAQHLLSQPYLELVQRFVVLREPPDVPGRVVRGALAGTAQAQHLESNTNVPDRAVLYSDTDGMWIDLALGRLQAALTQGTTARRDFLSTPLGEDYRFSNTAFGMDAGPAISVAAAVRPGERALLADLNTAIEELLASAEYDRLLRRHLEPDLARKPMPSETVR